MRITIRKFALLICKCSQRFSLAVICSYSSNKLTNFMAICANILYRRCSYCAGNPAECFKSCKSSGNSCLYKFIPIFTCTNCERCSAAGIYFFFYFVIRNSNYGSCKSFIANQNISFSLETSMKFLAGPPMRSDV